MKLTQKTWNRIHYVMHVALGTSALALVSLSIVIITTP